MKKVPEGWGWERGYLKSPKALEKVCDGDAVADGAEPVEEVESGTSTCPEDVGIGSGNQRCCCSCTRMQAFGSL